MDEDFELKHFKLDTTYWWFDARKHITFDLIRKTSGDIYSKILDVGCGGGILIKFLKENGFKDIYGIDISNKAIKICKKRGIKNVFIGDCTKMRFDKNMFDIIIAGDILEHIKNEDIALNEFNRVLKKNGKLIVFVPAFNFLWSQHDELCHHYRRYSKYTLMNALKKANFKVERISFWNFMLFFPISLLKLSQHLLKNKNQNKNQMYKTNRLVNNFLPYLLGLENWILRRVNFPFGLSLFAVARKINSS